MAIIIFITAIVLLSMGVVTLAGATYMEIRYHAPIYIILVKIGTAIFAIGTCLFGAACALGAINIGG